MVVSVVVVLVAIAVLAAAGVSRRQELARERAEAVRFLRDEDYEPLELLEPVPSRPVSAPGGHRRRPASRHARSA